MAGRNVVGSQGSHCGKETYKYGMGEGSIEPCGDGFKFEIKVWKRGICVGVADSFCCTAEAHTAL